MFEYVSDLHHVIQVLYALLIGVGIIAFWRGVWGLQDKYLFPENEPLSLWTSTLVGLAILLATHYVTQALT